MRTKNCRRELKRRVERPSRAPTPPVSGCVFALSSKPRKTTNRASGSGRQNSTNFESGTPDHSATPDQPWMQLCFVIWLW